MVSAYTRLSSFFRSVVDKPQADDSCRVQLNLLYRVNLENDLPPQSFI